MKVRQHEAQLLDIYPHRAGVETCPVCNKHSDMKMWGIAKNIEHIILDPQKHRKSDSIIVISTCVRCMEPSWIHLDITHGSWEYITSGIPKSVAKKINEEALKRTRNAVKKFSNSLCITCKNLEEVSFSGLYFYATCPGRSGGVCEGKCDIDNYVKMK